MTDDATPQSVPEDPAPATPVPHPPATTADPAPAAADASDAATTEASGESAPGADLRAATAEIERLRKENASRRVAARDAEANARKEIAEQIGKALGLVADDTPPDPQVLAEQIATERAAAAQARTELAVYRAARAAGADPDALLDSRAFIASISALDASADDFASQVNGLIKEAVTANPKLRAVQVAPKSGADLSGGTGETNGQLTREQLAALPPADRLKAASEGRLSHILNGR